MSRHTRQVRLVEVGEAGQARLSETDVTVLYLGLAGQVQARYLAGAGVRSLVALEDAVADAARRTDAEVRVSVRTGGKPSVDALVAGGTGALRSEPEGLLLEHPAAADVARGAHAALSQLREALGIRAPP